MSKRLRIAHVTATFPPYLGGTGQVCYHNALELARRGHDVTVFTAAHPPGEYDYPAEITVRRLPVAFRFGNAPILPRLLELTGYDVIHLHYPFYSGAEFAVWAARRSGARLVVTYHQDVLLPGLLGLIAKAHRHTLERLVLGGADLVLFTTLDYAETSQAAWLLKSRPDHVDELPNGVDVSRFSPELPSTTIRERLGLSSQDLVGLLVAGLDRAHYFKGVEVALQSWAQIASEAVKLVIVGDGDLRAEYEHRSRGLGLEGRVFFAGRVSDEELPLYYAAADFGLLPSVTRGEAFGIVLLEAMACGKPVVASRLPGVRTVVSDGLDGYLFDPASSEQLADAIRTLQRAPARRLQIGGRGRARVEAQFAWPRLAERLEGLYRGVLSGDPPSIVTAVTAHEC